uniref:Uncharacterized protein n=1 Tax=Chenopodium quinoa TaxID=63459 RepID=A0A803NC76_CHEQI
MEQGLVDSSFRMKLLKRLERLQSTGRKQHLAIYGYAVRFFQYNCSLMPFFEVEDSRTLDVAYDMDLIRVSWQVQKSRKNFLSKLGLKYRLEVMDAGRGVGRVDFFVAENFNIFSLALI